MAERNDTRDSRSQAASRPAAVALKYQPGDEAPRVVAKGKGIVAQQIIAKAKEAGVFVHESPELLELLIGLDLDARIPPELYVTVAELLAWVYRVEQQKKGAMGKL
ncbi:flagellar biosynthesis protein FlhB [Hydrogenophilus thermoluteolus]|uniref:EscU/YscU/HrcU family type III secretion system export apparatus switch protein n=1 Tax=Hydrogenophilus thermoluteolus TaxID=297 RepID=UPI0024A2630D|nr:EscU/YscU/HrcU family type III secretion system export apparatus switch protein [Hydrogenophilus thermoluteolus]GLW61578.1 flagellar biosynthesis protein FlhB [Hydrogenophilus thermoluteolus]